MARAMPEVTTYQPHRGCQALTGNGRVRTRCSCAYSRSRMLELFPSPSWTVGDAVDLDVTADRYAHVLGEWRPSSTILMA